MRAQKSPWGAVCLVVVLAVCVAGVRGHCGVSSLSLSRACGGTVGGVAVIENIKFRPVRCTPDQYYTVWVCPGQGDTLSMDGCEKQTITLNPECNGSSSASASDSLGIGKRLGRAELVADVFKTLAAESGPAGLAIGGEESTAAAIPGAGGPHSAASAQPAMGVGANGIHISVRGNQHGDRVSVVDARNRLSAEPSVPAGEPAAKLASERAEENRATGVSVGVGTSSVATADAATGGDDDVDEDSEVSTGVQGRLKAATIDAGTGMDDGADPVATLAGATIPDDVVVIGAAAPQSAVPDEPLAYAMTSRVSEVQEHLEKATTAEGGAFSTAFLKATQPFNWLVEAIMQDDKIMGNKIARIRQELNYLETNVERHITGETDELGNKIIDSRAALSQKVGHDMKLDVQRSTNELFDVHPPASTFMTLGRDQTGPAGQKGRAPVFTCIEQQAKDLVAKASALPDADRTVAMQAAQYWLQKMCTADAYLKNQRATLLQQWSDLAALTEANDGAPVPKGVVNKRKSMVAKTEEDAMKRVSRVQCDSVDSIFEALQFSPDKESLFTEGADSAAVNRKTYAATAFQTLQSEEIRKLEGTPNAAAMIQGKPNLRRVPEKVRNSILQNRPLSAVLAPGGGAESFVTDCAVYAQTIVGGANPQDSPALD